MVRYIASSLPHTLRQPATITMYGSEINGSIFSKAYTQNAQESESVLRERMVLLLTTTVCPREKKHALSAAGELTGNNNNNHHLASAFPYNTREKVQGNDFPPEEEEEEENRL